MANRKIIINKIAKINAESIRSKNAPNVIHYLDTSSITKNKIDNIQILDSRIAPFPSRAQRKVKNKTIIYSTVRPEQEHFGIIEERNKDLIVSSGFLTIDVVDKEIDPKYLYYLITRKDITNYLQRVAVNNVSAYPSINPDDLGVMEFIIPNDLRTQKKIADVLSALDAKIELNARVNAELESLAKTIYDYWFVQFAPHKSAGGGLVWNEELKREIPLGWEADNIMRLGDLLGGGTPKTSEPSYWGGNIPFFTPKDADDSIFVLNTMDYITKAGLESCSSRLYPKGTIFITARGTVGKINVASQDMAMNQSCYAIQAKPEINYYFLHQHSMHLVQYLKAKSNGSIFDAIVSNDIKLTPIVIPPLLLIQKFGEHIKDLYEKILVNKQESQALTEVRDWLLPLLMNGQVKV
ncbi:MAG: restriction endonuclease subunit S [Anaerolineales bacterium]|nr:restriction endonuclease subunit S [Anaerolineales bacterium]